jgi:hypothetical protein
MDRVVNGRRVVVRVRHMPVVCPECSAEFKGCGDLRPHLRKVHGYAPVRSAVVAGEAVQAVQRRCDELNRLSREALRSVLAGESAGQGAETGLAPGGVPR